MCFPPAFLFHQLCTWFSQRKKGGASASLLLPDLPPPPMTTFPCQAVLRMAPRPNPKQPACRSRSERGRGAPVLPRLIGSKSAVGAALRGREGGTGLSPAGPGRRAASVVSLRRGAFRALPFPPGPAAKDRSAEKCRSWPCAKFPRWTASARFARQARRSGDGRKPGSAAAAGASFRGRWQPAGGAASSGPRLKPAALASPGGRAFHSAGRAHWRQLRRPDRRQRCGQGALPSAKPGWLFFPSPGLSPSLASWRQEAASSGDRRISKPATSEACGREKRAFTAAPGDEMGFGVPDFHSPPPATFHVIPLPSRRGEKKHVRMCGWKDRTQVSVLGALLLWGSEVKQETNKPKQTNK
ncbi:uncharacterized protein LOC140705484 [Pogona vitticeps]